MISIIIWKTQEKKDIFPFIVFIFYDVFYLKKLFEVGQGAHFLMFILKVEKQDLLSKQKYIFIIHIALFMQKWIF